MDIIYLCEIEQKTSYNCFKWGEEGVQERDSGGDLANVQHKPIWNCHNESPHIMNIS
jgi:hypothetical protein